MQYLVSTTLTKLTRVGLVSATIPPTTKNTTRVVMATLVLMIAYTDFSAIVISHSIELPYLLPPAPKIQDVTGNGDFGAHDCAYGFE